jgi:hypothetical protein
MLSAGASLLAAGAKGTPAGRPGISCDLSLAQALKSLPSGNWTLSITPYFGTGWDALPVDVSNVTTEATKGLSVENVLLRNLSPQKVTGVKFRWYLREKQGSSALRQGETPLLDVDIPAGGQLKFSYCVASFAEIARPLAKEGKLNGDFVIEVLASGVVYEDGSKWNVREVLKGDPAWETGGKQRKVAVISHPDNAAPDITLNGTPVASYVKTAGVLPAPQGCQDQDCGFCSQCSCYQCVPASGACCRVNSCTSCTNARCGRQSCLF